MDIHRLHLELVERSKNNAISSVDNWVWPWERLFRETRYLNAYWSINCSEENPNGSNPAVSRWSGAVIGCITIGILARLNNTLRYGLRTRGPVMVNKEGYGALGDKDPVHRAVPPVIPTGRAPEFWRFSKDTLAQSFCNQRQRSNCYIMPFQRTYEPGETANPPVTMLQASAMLCGNRKPPLKP